MSIIVGVSVSPDGQVDRWGRARRVAVARVERGAIVSWEDFDVRWDELHDTGGEGAHHARVARFVREHALETVVAAHMGPGMVQMLGKLGVAIRVGASGPARDAVAAVSEG